MSGTYILIPDFKTTVPRSDPIDLVTERWEADRSWVIGERDRATGVTAFYHRSYLTFGSACRSRGLEPKEVRRRKIVETTAPTPALPQFDAYEVHPCVIVGQDKKGTVIYEQCSPGDPNIACWSVFGHCVTGGLESLTDHATEKEAGIEAARLESLLPKEEAAPRPRMKL